MAKHRGQKRRLDDETIGPRTNHQSSNVAATPPSKKARIEGRRTLFIRSLAPTATNDTLTNFFSQHYPVKHATVVIDPKTKVSRGYGFVTFTDADDAAEAQTKLDNKILDGKHLRLEVAEPRARKAETNILRDKGLNKTKLAQEKQRRVEEIAESRKLPKLIIRNLPWSIKKPEQLEKVFQRFGKIRYVDLPNERGKLSGFGFVTMKARKHAVRAMEELNGKEVDGRPVAVDWAVSKEEWEEQKGKDAGIGDEEEDVSDEDKAEAVADDEKEQADKADEVKAVAEMSQEEADLANFMRDFGQDLESEEDNDDEQLEEEENSQHEAHDDGDTPASEVSEEERPVQKPKRLTDNSTTVFVRNLPYTIDDESLKSHFAQFGAVRYARIVMDRATNRPAGTGFVCFIHANEFDACLRAAPRQKPRAQATKHSVLQDETVDSDGRFTIEGRVLQVSHAVSKEEASRLSDANTAARKGGDKDKRHLYLLSEGSIPHGSALHSLLTPSEIKIRDQSAQQRKKQIQSNPSLHLSLRRLAIRNIPRSMDSKGLKALAREAIVGFASDVKSGARQPLSREENARGGQDDKDAEHNRKLKGKGVVKQAKIVFETKEGKKVEESKSVDAGGGRSRGYGFVEYSSHRWALMGLRWLNGHALKNEAGKTVRLIVEFAIENAQVVTRRRAAEEKFRTRDQQIVGAEANGGKTSAKTVKGDDKPRGKGKNKKSQVAGNAAAEQQDKPGKKDAAEKLAMRQRIIGRKRMARKHKKAAR